MTSRVILSALFLANAVSGAFADDVERWTPVTGTNYSVSGLARIERHDRGANVSADQFLAVHDTKPSETPRVSLVTVEGDGAAGGGRATALSLSWEKGNKPPNDLEAICAIPGRDGQFLVLASDGTLLRISYARGATAIKVEQELDPLENENPADEKDANDFEALCVASVGGEQVLLWASRGLGDDQAQVHSAVLDLDGEKVKVKHAKRVDGFKSPMNPSTNVRAISDLRVDVDGWVIASAASDPDTAGNNDPFDNGPFESMIYVVGRLKARDKIEPAKPGDNPPKPVAVKQHKVEAIEFFGDKDLLVGTDDEDLGGFITAIPRQ